MKYVITIILLLIFPYLALADIYMQQDERGNVTYSDTPLKENAELIATPKPITTTTANRSETSETAKQPLKTDSGLTSDTPITYTKFSFIAPQDQDTIQNQPIIPVQFSVEPALRKGDKIQLFLDGRMWGEPSESTNLNINILERGTHQLFAVIIDANQKVLQKTNTITIYVHRASSLFKPN